MSAPNGARVRRGSMRPSSWTIPTRVAVAVIMTLSTLVVVLSTSVSSASAHGTAADPTVSGPVPFSATNPIEPATLATTFPLSQVGYEQSEYFISGTASSYTSPSPLATNGQWSVTPNSTAPYETRVVVN